MLSDLCIYRDIGRHQMLFRLLLQRFGEILGDRHDPFLASLAAQEHLWSRPILSPKEKVMK